MIKTLRLGLLGQALRVQKQPTIASPSSIFPDYNNETILGIESPLWTETVTTIDEIEYLAFPRIIGHAELGWSSKENRSWTSYKARINRHQVRMKLLGIDYYKSPLLFSKE